MKRLSILFLLAAACSSGGGTTTPAPLPGHGAISISVVPNPVIAQPVSGDTYSFPMDLAVRETGGRPVTISRVSVNVFALGGIRVYDESYDAARMRTAGYPTNVAANGELRYHFAPKQSVPNEAVFSGVTAELRVEGADDTGTPVAAQTSVTVRR